MRRVYDHDIKIKQDPVSGAILASAVIGAAASTFQSEEQKKIAASDRDAREQARVEEQARLDEIAANTRPEEEAAGAIEFGSGDKSVSEGFNQFIAPTQPSALGGSTGRAGLGFSV